MLDDNDPRKWIYEPKTEAKHAVLTAYLKAWLVILSREAKRWGLPARLVLVDGFAGRGHYVDGEPGSPLILRDLAGRVVSGGTAGEIEIILVERDPDNHAELSRVLGNGPTIPGVTLHTPLCESFAEAAKDIMAELLKQPRPSFWFIDPFGFSGVPLSTVRAILNHPRSEVFITFMARDVNRFLESPNHRVAIAELVGLDGTDLDKATDWVLSSSRRVQAVKDLYQGRLLEAGGAKYVWPFRVAASGSEDTVYYLMHGSNHIKAFREMKDATHQIGGWRSAFLGADDFAVTGQLELPDFATDRATLKQQVLNAFAGRDLPYDPPSGSSESGFLNEAYPDPRFHMWVEKDFHAGLVELISEGKIRKTPVDTKGGRGLRGKDRIQFPGAQQLSL